MPSLMQAIVNGKRLEVLMKLTSTSASLGKASRISLAMVCKSVAFLRRWYVVPDIAVAIVSDPAMIKEPQFSGNFFVGDPTLLTSVFEDVGEEISSLLYYTF